MNVKLLTEKFKGLLQESDLQEFESGVTDLINEQVATRLEVEKDKLAILAEQYAEEKTAKATKKVKGKLKKDFDEKLKKLEESIVDKLDRFLESEISANISEKTLKSIAINESAQPIIEGICNLFENKFVKLDTRGHKVVKSLKSRLDESKKSQEKLLKDKMELSQLLESTSIKTLIAEKSKMLTESQSRKLVKMCEGKTFDELYKKIDTYTDILVESSNSSKKVIKESKTDMVSDKEFLKESVKGSVKGSVQGSAKVVPDSIRRAQHLI